MALIDFTLSNARRFYSSMENPLGVKGLSEILLILRLDILLTQTVTLQHVLSNHLFSVHTIILPKNVKLGDKTSLNNIVKLINVKLVHIIDS